MEEPRRTEDFERVICTCGEHMECIDNPEHPEDADVWYCKNCNRYHCGV